MENIINIYKNNEWVRYVVNCIAAFAILKYISLPGFVWAGVIVGLMALGIKAAYKAYVRINNMPAEAGKWIDDRVNNIFDDNDPYKW